MKRKITFNKLKSGGYNAKIIIPPIMLESLKITQEERVVEIKLEGNKIIIEKAEE